MEPLRNKVAESGIITINLEDFLPGENIAVIDLKDFLFMEMILKEKDFREKLKTTNWQQYQGAVVAIGCTADAIIPMWAYMLLATGLAPFAQEIIIGSKEEAAQQLLLKNIGGINAASYQDARVVIKGCGDVPVPPAAYAAITARLQPYVKSIMYGEPCSTVPVYKKKAV